MSRFISCLPIRRTFLAQVGFFDQYFGCVADFEWGMRIYAAQLTQPAYTASERLHALAMTRSALQRSSSIHISLSLSLLHEMEYSLYDDYLYGLALSGLFTSYVQFCIRLRIVVLEALARSNLLFRRLICSFLDTATIAFHYSRKR
jgi:GT2 family glycosyltransferase